MGLHPHQIPPQLFQSIRPNRTDFLDQPDSPGWYSAIGFMENTLVLAPVMALFKDGCGSGHTLRISHSAVGIDGLALLPHVDPKYIRRDYWGNTLVLSEGMQQALRDLLR